MTQYPRPTDRPEGLFYGFHHNEMFVSNAKQAADWMCLRLGFKRVAYRGLETGSRRLVSHVVRQNRIWFVFTSFLLPESNEVMDFVSKHGDGGRDVAFECDNVRLIWKKATERGAVSAMPPTEFTDEFGTVVIAKIQTYGDCVHSLIQKNGYKGVFLPGFQAVDPEEDTLAAGLPPCQLEICDHVVGNQPDKQMVEVANWYSRCLDFHQFWSVDDTQVHTEYSALRSIVMCDFDRVVKMPINEPAKGKKKSQIQEYVEYHGGAGVQHIALRTRDIIASVSALKSRGMKFLNIPQTYYTDLRKRLADSPIDVEEDLAKIEELSILVDFDDKGYLLQIFTEPVEDRPTLFYEIIQRHNHEGFGAGNFKALFRSIELAQQARGNLENTPAAGSAAVKTRSRL